LLLLGHMGLENNDNKAKNVWNIFRCYVMWYI
jgi:hypothetical protein